MAKIIGNALPNIPWQDKPANCRDIVWRYDQNPIIQRDEQKDSNSIFNSAVIPWEDGFMACSAVTTVPVQWTFLSAVQKTV